LEHAPKPWRRRVPGGRRPHERIEELKVRIHSPPAESQQTFGSWATVEPRQPGFYRKGSAVFPDTQRWSPTAGSRRRSLSLPPPLDRSDGPPLPTQEMSLYAAKIRPEAVCEPFPPTPSPTAGRAQAGSVARARRSRRGAAALASSGLVLEAQPPTQPHRCVAITPEAI